MCPPCKTIIDGNILGASALYLADMAEGESESSSNAARHLPPHSIRAIAAAARYLSGVALGATETLIYAIEKGILSAAQIDEAHAMSELSCHRATYLREQARNPRHANAGQLMAWAEELRLHATKLVGGEYGGEWTIDGIEGISKP